MIIEFKRYLLNQKFFPLTATNSIRQKMGRNYRIGIWLYPSPYVYCHERDYDYELLAYLWHYTIILFYFSVAVEFHIAEGRNTFTFV